MLNGLVLLLAGLMFGVPLRLSGADATKSILLMMLAVMCIGISAELFTTFLVQRIWKHQHQKEHRRLIAMFRTLRRVHALLSLTLFTSTLLITDWVGVVRTSWSVPGWLGLDALVILSPLLIGFLLSWSSFFRVERAFFETWASHAEGNFWSCSGYVKQAAQEELARILEPWYFLACCHTAWSLQSTWQIQVLLFAGMLMLGWLLLPWCWKSLWPAWSLPKGPLRDQFLELSDQMGVHCSDFLIWDTKGTQALAMTVGVLPCSRFVIISDKLLDRLNRKELLLVVAHELGHSKHYHFLLKMGLLGILLLGFGMVATSFIGRSTPDVALLLGLLLGGVVAVLLFRFGYRVVSHLCEQDADVTALRSVETFETGRNATGFSRNLVADYEAALGKACYYNGESMHSASLTHGSNWQRLNYLYRAVEEPKLLDRLRNEVRGIWLVLSASYGVMLGVISAGSTASMPQQANSPGTQHSTVEVTSQGRSKWSS